MQAWFTALKTTAETYDVNVQVFVVLYVISIPMFYAGLATCIVGFRKHGWKSVPPSAHTLFGCGLLIFAWLLPYAYLLIASRGLPWWFWTAVAALLVATGYSAVRKLAVGREQHTGENQ